jgi:hypothetical protein
MNESISAALKDWIPFRLMEDGQTTSCRWLYLGDKKIREPFFDETISKCREFPNNSQMMKCMSSADILPEWAERINSIPPTAIIFHISRCGSTLISQLLALQAQNIVLSEVPFFDELLRWGNKNEKMQEALPQLKAAISLYAAKRQEESRHLFIKADSWHIHFYKELRELYPQVPFILLYRKPDEVIRSQQKRRGMQAIPGLLEPGIFGFDREQIMQLGLDEYMAKVIETYLEGFLKIMDTDKLVLPVNYAEGALAIVNKIAALTGIQISEEEMEEMKKRSAFHAKYPGQVFAEEQTKEALPAYQAKSFDLYNEVEKRKIALTV